MERCGSIQFISFCCLKYVVRCEVPICPRRLRTKFFCNIVLHYWVFLQELVVFNGPLTLEDKAIQLFQNVGQQTHSDRAPYSREQILNSITLRAWKLACPESVHENINVDVPGKWSVTEVQNLDHMDLCTFICYFVMETYDVATWNTELKMHVRVTPSFFSCCCQDFNTKWKCAKWQILLHFHSKWQVELTNKLC